LADHFFRREYVRLVALLARRVGARHLDLVEDAVQNALLAGLTTWMAQGRPDDPAAWLYRVALNDLIGNLRRKAGHRKILERAVAAAAEGNNPPPSPHFTGEVSDDLLRMLFVCCDPAIPRGSQMAMALKTLCGFGTAEIALRLFTSEANIYKRLSRARKELRRMDAGLDTPEFDTLKSRLPGVHMVLYLLFNEGYLSSNPELAIRRELCNEAIRLTTLLAGHPVGAAPETFALLALMHLHHARLDSRCDGTGGLLLLEEQDRSQWDRTSMALGAEWLQRSASGSTFSRYHAEAGIAAAHCFAPSFAETRWDEIAHLYELLERTAPSPLNIMNRAVAVAEWQGPEAGRALLQSLAPPNWLSGSYLWDAVVSDLHRRTGKLDIARLYSDRALASAPTEAVRAILKRRLTASCKDRL
jgi:RNA polymerase sigma-70 factor (ECF subfamily)